MRTALSGARRRALVLLAGLALIGIGGVAWATIPENGVYTGCYDKQGALRIVDASQKCKKGETRITWNEQGQPGVQGDRGQQGPAGPGVAMEARNWCGGEGCPDALELTSAGGPVTLMTLHRPDNGAPPWDKTIVMATVNMVQYGGINNFERIQVQCQAGGATMINVVAHDAPLTLTFSGPYEGGPNDLDATLTCAIRNQWDQNGLDLHLYIGWANLTLVPASYINNVNVP